MGEEIDIFTRIIEKLRCRGYNGKIIDIPPTGNSAIRCYKIEKDGHWHFVKIYSGRNHYEIDNFRKRINSFMELSLNKENYLVSISDKVTEPEKKDGYIFPFIVEACGKCNLEELISSNPGKVKEDAVKIATQLATALSACAEKGWVHRDVKPSNIIVFDDGYRLGDFNTLRSISGMTLGTMGTMDFGTNGYVAPEVEIGSDVIKNPNTEARDISAVGTVFYQAFTGSLHDDLFPKIKVKYGEDEAEENDYNAYRALQKSPEKLFKHLQIDEKIRNPVIRAIIKKCHTFDESKYSEWRKKFDAEIEVAQAETPWHERYQTHKELLVDLKVAAYQNEFDEIISALELSAIKNSGKLAACISESTSERESIEDKLKRIEGNLKAEGISTNGDRNWLLKGFDNEVIKKKFEEHAAEIRKEYNAYKSKEDSENRAVGDEREEIGAQLGSMASVLEAYGKIIRGESENDMAARLEFAKELRALETRYSPEKRICSFKDRKSISELVAEEIIKECDEYVDLHISSKTPAIIERVEEARKKKSEVESILSSVKQKCGEIREKYLASVSANAESKSVSANLDEALAALQGLESHEFDEVKAAAVEIFSIDYVLHRLYPRNREGRNGEYRYLEENFLKGIEEGEKGQLKFRDTVEDVDRQNLGKLGIVADAITAFRKYYNEHEIALENKKTEIEGYKGRFALTESAGCMKLLAEFLARGDGSNFFGIVDRLKESYENNEERIKCDEDRRHYDKLKANFELVSSHVDSVLKQTFADADAAYLNDVPASHTKAVKSGIYTIRGSPVAQHNASKEKEGLFLERQNYLRAKGMAAKVKAAKSLETHAKRLERKGLASESEVALYTALNESEQNDMGVASSYFCNFVYPYCIERKGSIPDKFSNLKDVLNNLDSKIKARISSKANPSAEEIIWRKMRDELLSRNSQAAEFMLETAGNDILIHKLLFAHPITASMIMAYEAAAAKFPDEHWIAFDYAKKAAALTSGGLNKEKYVQDSRAKLFALEGRICDEEMPDFYDAASILEFRTALTTEGFRKARIYREKRSSAMDLLEINNIKSVNPLAKEIDSRFIDRMNSCQSAGETIEEALDAIKKGVSGRRFSPGEITSTMGVISHYYNSLIDYTSYGSQPDELHPYVKRLTVKLASWVSGFRGRMKAKLDAVEDDLIGFDGKRAEEISNLKQAETSEEERILYGRIKDIENARARTIELQCLLKEQYRPIEQAFYNIFGGRGKFFGILDSIGNQHDRDKPEA